MGLGEVIQDSEDEEIFAPLRVPGPSTMEAEAREAARAASASTRPRPRPAYKGALSKAAPASEVAGQATSSSSTTRPPNPPVASPSSSSTLINHSAAYTHPPPTKDVDMLSLDIAERAKLRSRGSKANTKQPTPPIDEDVIEITSSDDDLNIRPPTRGPKAKVADRDAPSPKKRAKRAHIPVDLSMDDASPAVIPIATSAPSSQLPPSDPPPPSTPPEPTPANARPTSRIVTSPLSSPLPPPPPPPKRKRKTSPKDSDDEGSVRHRGTLRKEDSGLAMPPPPPPFFADPSSSSVPASDTLVETSSSTRASDGPTASKPTKNKGKRKVIDDDDFEDDWPLDPPPRPKPRQRKKQPADEDDWQGDDAPKPARKSRKKVTADDDEEEWGGDAPPKRKPRAPPKKKGKKDELPRRIVEVVIEQPRGGRKGRKGKGDPQLTGDVSGHGQDASAAPDTTAVADKTTAEGDSSPLSETEVEKPADKPSTPPPASPKRSLPVLRDGESILNSPRSKSKSKGKKRAVIDSDEEENDGGEGEQAGSPPKKQRRELTKGRKSAPAALEQEKEEEEGEPGSSNRDPRPRVSSYSAVTAPFKSPLPAPGTTPKLTLTNRSYTVSGRSSQLPMSELLKKVNSQPGSPFASPRPTHSPYGKTTKSFLRKIAPLHPNRRTPPPPPPRPPPPKKSKKQLELEEKWEMELEDSVEGWYCMSQEERAALLRAKRNAEMGFED
ncbi:uncharacterized protein C8Q71DRAFT_537437 [Rhodofomes roseus]|uniref:Uncharacterized protein n=1 Tax=Rhodofomes roseus TaxID=34475 RepID=A0ABQ8KKG4_9APHY|nr:uncharacterized protein C8Q71DRAFT_537437 [Rhodofomes roseus]KAH9838591.1 hypothetical protein C8Q71DRAFT_537437 [Rhodofomes roseus]